MTMKKGTKYYTCVIAVWTAFFVVLGLMLYVKKHSELLIGPFGKFYVWTFAYVLSPLLGLTGGAGTAIASQDILHKIIPHNRIVDMVMVSAFGLKTIFVVLIWIAYLKTAWFEYKVFHYIRSPTCWFVIGFFGAFGLFGLIMRWKGEKNEKNN